MSRSTLDNLLATVLPPVRRVMESNGNLLAQLADRSKLDRGVGDFACPACRETVALTPFERRTDVNNVIYDLWLCLRCHAVLNATHLREIAAGDEFAALQAGSSDEFYAVDEAYLNSVPAAIESNTFLDFLFQQYPECPRGVMLDFGAGQGITAGAGARHFDKVYAAELSLNVLKQVHAVMPLREKVIVTDDYLAIPDRFDLVTSMHVLEHLPHMRDILDNLVGRMNEGAALFYQVPMLRREYLVNVHYTFFNEASARALNEGLGLKTVGVWYDNNVDFLTCIARKPA
jgi:hypothetical protein